MVLKKGRSIAPKWPPNSGDILWIEINVAAVGLTKDILCKLLWENVVGSWEIEEFSSVRIRKIGKGHFITLVGGTILVPH